MRRKVKRLLNRRMAVQCCWIESGEMSPRMQAKLLRFLNDGTFRRVTAKITKFMLMSALSAPRRNLGGLRCKDCSANLYYRLNVLTLNFAAVARLPQDIMPLTELFVARFADEQGVPDRKLSPSGTVLTRYGWPGNVRQQNAIYRALTQRYGRGMSCVRRISCCPPSFGNAATVAVGGCDGKVRWMTLPVVLNVLS